MIGTHIVPPTVASELNHYSLDQRLVRRTPQGPAYDPREPIGEVSCVGWWFPVKNARLVKLQNLIFGTHRDKHSLDNLNAYLINTHPWQNYPNLIYPIQYTNYLPFDDVNAWSTLDATITSALNLRDGQRIVGARVDVITHSMGGLVARVYSSKQQAYRTWRDRMQGRFHQIITMDTPEIGSPIAQYLLVHAFNTFQFDDPLSIDVFPSVVWSIVCGSVDAAATEAIYQCLENHKMPMGPPGQPLIGAIASLASGSASLTSIESYGPKIRDAKWQAIRAQVKGNNLANQLVLVINNLIKGTGYKDSIGSLFTKDTRGGNRTTTYLFYPNISRDVATRRTAERWQVQTIGPRSR